MWNLYYSHPEVKDLAGGDFSNSSEICCWNYGCFWEFKVIFSKLLSYLMGCMHPSMAWKYGSMYFLGVWGCSLSVTLVLQTQDSLDLLDTLILLCHSGEASLLTVFKNLKSTNWIQKLEENSNNNKKKGVCNITREVNISWLMWLPLIRESNLLATITKPAKFGFLVFFSSSLMALI